MVKKVLAVSCGHEITAEFESEDEYELFCAVIFKECLGALLGSLALEDIIRLWKLNNGV